jgi:hypothetical protein
MGRRRFRLERLRVFETGCADVVARVRPLPDETECAWVCGDAELRAIDRVAAEDGYRRRFREMRRHLETGGRIAVALRNGRPIGWDLFRSREQTTILWLHLRGDERSFFSFGAYVVKNCRGDNVLADLIRFAAAGYAEHGFERVCSVSHRHNRASLGTHSRIGAKQVGRISFLRHAAGGAIILSDAGLAIGRFNATRPYVYRLPRARGG